MILLEARFTLKKCPFSGCVGALQDRDGCCFANVLLLRLCLQIFAYRGIVPTAHWYCYSLICGRKLSFDTQTRSLMRVTTIAPPTLVPPHGNSRKGDQVRYGPTLPGSGTLETDEPKTFCNIHMVQWRAPIHSAAEAHETLEHDETDAYAWRYLDWSRLVSLTHGLENSSEAISELQWSISYGM